MDRHLLRAGYLVGHRGRHPQPTDLGPVHEQAPRRRPVVREMFLAGQRSFQDGRQPGIVAPLGQFLVGDEFGLDHQPQRLVVHRLDRIADRGHRALGQRHYPHRRHLDPGAGRGGPVDGPGQGARPQVKDALVGVQGAIPDVEGLVVDQQADDLSVGDVDDGLPGVGEAVAGLRVRQWPDLVHGVEVGAGQAVGLALVQVAAQPDVPVRQRKDRFALREQARVERLLHQSPGLCPVRSVLDHGAPLSWSRSSATSCTTMSAPCARSSAAWPTRSTPTTRAKPPARPAATPAWASSKTAAWCAVTWSMSAAARYVSGAGLPRNPRCFATTPSMRTSNSPAMPAESSTCWVLALAETIAVDMPPALTVRMYVIVPS